MKTVKALIVIMALLVLVGVGCSSQEAEEPGASIKQKMTKVTNDISHRIHSPIDKAKATRSLGDKRVQEMDKALRNQ